MQPKKHYFAHIPTIAIFIVFAMSAPLGVLLFILKSIDKNAEKEEKAAAQAQLIEGLPVDDPAAYAEAVCSLMK